MTRVEREGPCGCCALDETDSVRVARCPGCGGYYCVACEELHGCEGLELELERARLEVFAFSFARGAW